MTDPAGDVQIGFIDSANTTIQMPMDVFNRVYNEIRSKEHGHLRFRETYDYTSGRSIKIIKANAECRDIVDSLPTLKFQINGGVTIELGPHAYV